MRRITGCTTLGGGGRSNAEGEERRLKVKERGRREKRKEERKKESKKSRRRRGRRRGKGR